MQFAMGKAQLGKIHRFPSSFRFKEININVNLDDSDLLGGKISLAVRDSDFNAKHGRLSVTMQRSHFGGSSYSFIFFFWIRGVGCGSTSMQGGTRRRVRQTRSQTVMGPDEASVNAGGALAQVMLLRSCAGSMTGPLCPTNLSHQTWLPWGKQDSNEATQQQRQTL